MQIGDVHVGVSIDPLDAVFIIAYRRRNEADALAAVLRLDTAQIFLCGGAVITGISRLSVGYADQQPDVLWTFGELFGNEPKGEGKP